MLVYSGFLPPKEGGLTSTSFFYTTRNPDHRAYTPEEDFHKALRLKRDGLAESVYVNLVKIVLRGDTGVA